MSTPVAIISVMGGVDRILEVELIDKAGRETDEVTIRLDNRDFAIEPPATGETITVEMGYLESGIYPMGQYIVSGVTVEGPPHTMMIHAKSADQKSTQKQHRTTKYQDKSLGDIVQEVAKRNGVEAQISGDLQSRKYPYEHQTEESDWHFLTRLANENDAVSTLKNGKWLFVPRAGGQSSGGEDMQSIVVQLTDIIKYQASVGDRPKHQNVKASHHDWKSGKAKKVTAEGQSGGKATYWLRHHFPTEDIAQHAAQAKMNELTRLEGEVSVTITGDPKIMAVGIVQFATGCAVMDDEWTIQTVTHRLTPHEGYETTIHGQSKNGNQNSSEGGGGGGE